MPFGLIIRYYVHDKFKKNMMKALKNNKHSRKGFTLVELLVVIAIIAILSVTAYVALGGQTGKARDSRRQQDLGAIQTALELYHINNSSLYPQTLDELVPNEMKTIPTDPTTKEKYPYAVEPGNKIYQLGATLEGEDGTYAAYVIGNSDKPLLTGVVPPKGGDCNQGVSDGSTTCVPLKIWK